MAEVPRQKTPASEAELASALIRAHAAVFGDVPTKKRATLLLAQWLIETAKGESIFNHNVGNLTANDASSVDFWRPPWFEPPPYDSGDAERLEVLHTRMLEGKAPRAFRAYDSLEEGATSYMRLIKDRYPRVLKAATAGSPRQFATAVHEEGYCPDPECAPDKTTGTFVALQKEINRKKLFQDLPNGGATKLAVVLVPLAIWGSLQWMKNSKK